MIYFFYFTDAASVQQVLNTLTAETCTDLELDKIKEALAAQLGIDASKIDVECPTQIRSNVHLIITVDTDSDETRRDVFEMMSNTEEFIAALNNKLPGKDNDFSDGTTPSIIAQGKQCKICIKLLCKDNC